MSKENGGPAYPVTPTDRSGQIGLTEWGMSLHDWYKGMAMQGLLSNTRPMWDFDDPETLAKISSEIADEMIAEREKEGESH